MVSAGSSPRRDQQQLRLMTQAARMYHLHGARQREIATQLGLSQAGVSRLLKLAEDQGIIQTVVVAPEGMHPELEEGLGQAYGLADVYVVDTDGSDDSIARALGGAAARHLEGHHFQGAVIGFTSWSVTLREMARMFEPVPDTGVTHVVEMLGDLGSPLLQHEAALATIQLAKAFGAEPVFLRTPGVVATSAMRDSALADAHVRRALELLDRVDVAFVGSGPADFHGPLEEGDNFFTAEQLAEARACGAVAQLHQRFIDERGTAVVTPLDELVVGITLAQVRRAKRRIAVAGGGSKHIALAAALAGGWIDVLVTDVRSATHLLAQAPPPPPPPSSAMTAATADPTT
jgi:DNA-binding transcriptional regulator LsrR (DeoR family)